MARVGIECKELMARELSQKINQAQSLFITSFNRLTVMDIEKLRRILKDLSNEYMVVKNSILKKVLDKSGLAGLAEFVDAGKSTGISFCNKDSAATSKALIHFAREYQSFEIKGGFVEGQVLSHKLVQELASLPPRDVLYGKVALGVKAPIGNFVNVLAGTLRGFVYILSKICEKKDR